MSRTMVGRGGRTALDGWMDGMDELTGQKYEVWILTMSVQSAIAGPLYIWTIHGVVYSPYSVRARGNRRKDLLRWHVKGTNETKGDY